MAIDFKSPPKRILLIKPSAIGDVVHTLPILKLLRTRFPQSHIAWLLTPPCDNLLEDHPLLNEVITFDRQGYGDGWRNPASLLRLFAFQKKLRQQNFDLVIDLQGLFRSGWLAWQTRAPIRIGFTKAREFAHLFYTHRVDVGTKDQHATDRYLKVAEALGCDTTKVDFEFHTTQEDRAHIDQILPNQERYAVLLPGTNWLTKRWPIEKFAALVQPLRENFNLQTIVAGSKDDIVLANQISGATNLAGKTTLRQLVELLNRAEVVIANDSGPMHIAAALNRPLITPFGPTNPTRTGPYRREQTVICLDIACSPCYSRKCSHQSCLRWLETEPVLKLAETQLAEFSSPTQKLG